MLYVNICIYTHPPKAPRTVPLPMPVCVRPGLHGASDPSPPQARFQEGNCLIL